VEFARNVAKKFVEGDLPITLFVTAGNTVLFVVAEWSLTRLI